MRSLLLLTVLAACSGDQPADVDANPAGPMCVKATYDLCTTEHDCTSGLCHYFMSDNFMICTQSCDTANPCPNDKNGTPGTCNMQGICKPAVPNMCHL
jgi:hypothetical protein